MTNLNRMDAIVTTDWLAAHLAEPDLRVVDGTWHMPQLKRDARAEFAQAHIPGAAFFDIDAIADHGTSLPHMLPSAADFASAVGALGIGSGDRVVVYDVRGVVSAARVWWTFRAFGHDAVAVLDGGLRKWQAEGRPVEAGAVKVQARASPRDCGPSWCGTSRRCARISRRARRRCSTRAAADASPAPSRSPAPDCAAAHSRSLNLPYETLYRPTARSSRRTSCAAR